MKIDGVLEQGIKHLQGFKARRLGAFATFIQFQGLNHHSAIIIIFDPNL